MQVKGVYTSATVYSLPLYPEEIILKKKKKNPEIQNLILNSAFLAHSRKSKRLPVAGSLSSE